MAILIETDEGWILFPYPKLNEQHQLSCFPAKILSIALFDDYEKALFSIKSENYREIEA